MISLTNIVFKNEDTYLKVDEVYGLVVNQGLIVSLAKVYNTFKQFTYHDKLKEIKISPKKMYYDNNLNPLVHDFYNQNSGKLEEVHIDEI